VKIARVLPISRPHILSKYIEVEKLKTFESFEKALEVVANLEIGYGQGAKKALRGRGVECEDFYADIYWLQKMWADENGLDFSDRDWTREILYAQLATYKPDVVFFQGTEVIGGSKSWQDFRSSQPNIRVTVGHYGHTHSLSGLDHAFLGFPCLVTSALSKGLSASLLYHSFDKTVLNRLEKSRSVRDEVTFTGAVGYRINSHFNRYEFLLELTKRTPLKLWVDEYFDMFKVSALPKQLLLEPEIQRTFLERAKEVLIHPSRVQHKIMLTFKKYFPDKEKEQFPIDRCREGVYGLEVHNLVRNSLATIQFHSTAMRGEVGAHRLFHSPGAGGCLITDHGSNLLSLYEPDREVVSYTSVDECVEKVGFLLDNPKQAGEIAQAGQRRTLLDHTHDSRAPQIIATIESLM